MPPGRKYKPYPKKAGARRKIKQSAYRNKMNAYNKVVKKRNRNILRPFTETLTREYPRATTAGAGEQHFKFHNTTGAAALCTTAQMGVNVPNNGSGANHYMVPQDFTCVIPKAWYAKWENGTANGQFQGRVLKPNYLNLKCEVDWSAKVKDSEHASLTGIDDNWWVIQGWAKNTVLKQTINESQLPNADTDIGQAMAQIAAKCCYQSGIAGDPLDFQSKRKDVIIMRHHKIKPNLNNRYVAGVATLATHDAKPNNVMVFALPSVLNFSWTIKRKQLMRGNQFSSSYVPFVGFYNRNLSASAHEVTPDLHCSSKIYYTDM